MDDPSRVTKQTGPRKTKVAVTAGFIGVGLVGTALLPVLGPAVACAATGVALLGVVVLGSAAVKKQQTSIHEQMFKERTGRKWDSKQLGCFLCMKPFQLFKRPHHCRNCGRPCCSDCSSNKVHVPFFHYGEEVKVCDRCFLELKGVESTSGGNGSGS